MKTFARRLGSFFLDILQTFVLALSLFVISYLFLFQPHQVRGSSMAQNFTDNDFILTDKISYRFRQPQRGEVIIFKAPPSEPCAQEECEYIKRVIALPGETVQVQNGSYFVDQQKLNETYIPEAIKTDGGTFLLTDRPYTLRENEYFVSGDNRPYSHDSRAFGPIKRNSIIGRAWLRYWPVEKIGIIPEEKFN